MKKFQIIAFAFLFISISSCTENEIEEEMQEEQTSNIENNTVSSTDERGSLNYYSFTSYSLSNGVIYDFTVFEKDPVLTQSTDLGTYVRLFIKDLPTQTTTFVHRPDADFDVDTGQYFFNVARIGNSGSQEWYAPFVNTRPTAELKVTIENNVATFTVLDVELSDNFISPINSTEIFNLSFSINLSELVLAGADQTNSLVN